MWANGDPGPNGQSREDGQHPCQCATCSACPERTALTAAEAAVWADSHMLVCRKCMLAGHTARKPEPTRWERPLTFAPADLDPVEEKFQQMRDEVAATETQKRLFEEQADLWIETHGGGRWENASLTEWADKDALSDLKAFFEAVKNPSRGPINLILAGPIGTGKSYLLQAIIRELFNQRLVWPNKIRIGREDSLLVPMVTGLPTEMATHRAVLIHRGRVGAIFIDEAGRAMYPGGRPNQQAAWDMVTDFAYENDIPLVIATNMVVPPKQQAAVQAKGDIWDGAATGMATGAVGSSDEPAFPTIMSDAAFDRIITNTPRGAATTIMRANQRPAVARGELSR